MMIPQPVVYRIFSTKTLWLNLESEGGASDENKSL